MLGDRLRVLFLQAWVASVELAQADSELAAISSDALEYGDECAAILGNVQMLQRKFELSPTGFTSELGDAPQGEGHEDWGLALEGHTCKRMSHHGEGFSLGQCQRKSNMTGDDFVSFHEGSGACASSSQDQCMSVRGNHTWMIYASGTILSEMNEISNGTSVSNSTGSDAIASFNTTAATIVESTPAVTMVESIPEATAVDSIPAIAASDLKAYGTSESKQGTEVGVASPTFPNKRKLLSTSLHQKNGAHHKGLLGHSSRFGHSHSHGQGRAHGHGHAQKHSHAHGRGHQHSHRHGQSLWQASGFHKHGRGHRGDVHPLRRHGHMARRSHRRSPWWRHGGNFHGRRFS